MLAKVKVTCTTPPGTVVVTSVVMSIVSCAMGMVLAQRGSVLPLAQLLPAVER